MDAVEIVQFGSRGGSLAGLAFMAVILGIIAWAISRLAGGGKAATGLGAAVFAALMGVTYLSMFGGFCEAEIRDDEVALHYLIDPRVRTIPLDSIREARPYFAYKLSWRLDLVTDSGKRLTSASGRRDGITRAAERLQAAIAARAESAE